MKYHCIASFGSFFVNVGLMLGCGFSIINKNIGKTWRAYAVITLAILDIFFLFGIPVFSRLWTERDKLLRVEERGLSNIRREIVVKLLFFCQLLCRVTLGILCLP